LIIIFATNGNRPSVKFQKVFQIPEASQTADINTLTAPTVLWPWTVTEGTREIWDYSSRYESFVKNRKIHAVWPEEGFM
jgi:hypothetical protein